MSRVRVADIVRIVTARYDVTVEEITSCGRSKRILGPRLIACWLARRLTTQSLGQIGHHFGDRDHSTVLHAVNRVEAARERNPALREELALLELAIRADVGGAEHPADRCLAHIDTTQIARAVLTEKDFLPDRFQAVALARALLTLQRTQNAGQSAHNAPRLERAA